MRPPVIAGLGPGAGATTLAAALHGVDGGRWTGGPVDVLVVGRGEQAQLPAGVPVLVLRADGPAAAPPGPGYGAVVVLPEVPQWRGPDGPQIASGLLRLAPAERPPALHAAVDALLAVTAALVGSGVLDRPAAPARPVPLPVSRVTPVLLHRAEPVTPRLVAGRPLRVSPPVSPPPVPPARPRTRSLRLAPVPGVAPSVRAGEPDDDAVEGLSGDVRRRLTVLSAPAVRAG